MIPERALGARSIWLSPGVELSPGEIRWDSAGRVVAIGPPRGPVADLCVFPGLVDAHTHLQLAPVDDAPREFVPWAGAVLAARAATTAREHAARARAAALALLGEGVTAVGEIDSTGLSPGALAATAIGGRCYQEVTGFDLDAAGARQRVRERRVRGTPLLGAGLSPHAPYSVSKPLFAAAAAASRHLSIHCAETAEEQRFLNVGDGPFADLLRALGRLPDDFQAPGVGAVRWLERLGLLRASTQLVHCQELEPGDIEIIARARCPVVVCPGTIAWFGRTPPPLEQFLRAGISVGLGTDSRASNATWSLRRALADAAQIWPGIAPERLLGMATAGGARALSQPGIGRFCVGGRADLLAVPARHDRAVDHVEALVADELTPAFVLSAGRCHVPERSAVEPPASDPYSLQTNPDSR